MERGNLEIKKTKLMTKDSIRSKLVIDDIPIERVMDFDYMGCMISSRGNLEEEVKRNVTHLAKQTDKHSE